MPVNPANWWFTCVAACGNVICSSYFHLPMWLTHVSQAHDEHVMLWEKNNSDFHRIQLCLPLKRLRTSPVSTSFRCYWQQFKLLKGSKKKKKIHFSGVKGEVFPPSGIRVKEGDSVFSDLCTACGCGGCLRRWRRALSDFWGCAHTFIKCLFFEMLSCYSTLLWRGEALCPVLLNSSSWKQSYLLISGKYFD